MANTSQTNRQVDERAAHRRIWVKVAWSIPVALAYGFALFVMVTVHGAAQAVGR